MKTFNDFINEGQHFLRSISKNDTVVGAAFNELQAGDWFYVITNNKLCAQIIVKDFYHTLNSWAFITGQMNNIHDIDGHTEWFIDSSYSAKLYTSLDDALNEFPTKEITAYLNTSDYIRISIEEFKIKYLK